MMNIFCTDYDRSNVYNSYIDYNISEFVEEYRDKLQLDQNCGFKHLVKISDNNYNKIYKGLLEQFEGDIYIKDKHNSLIKILDVNLKIKDVEVVKIV